MKIICVIALAFFISACESEYNQEYDNRVDSAYNRLVQDYNNYRANYDTAIQSVKEAEGRTKLYCGGDGGSLSDPRCISAQEDVRARDDVVKELNEGWLRRQAAYEREIGQFERARALDRQAQAARVGNVALVVLGAAAQGYANAQAGNTAQNNSSSGSSSYHCHTGGHQNGECHSGHLH